MPDLTLTPAELRALTGYMRPAHQAEWLRANGWAHLPPTRRGDIPKVSRAYAEAKLSGQAAPQQRTGPNLAWMTEPRKAA